MQNILLVEDSKLIGNIIKNRIESELEYHVHWVTSFQQACQVVNRNEPDYFVCLAGLYLPDATSGEVVDYLLQRDIPVIVFTGDVSDDIRKNIWSKKVIDYVCRDSAHTVDDVIKLIKRIKKNSHIKVLVVDDSMVSLNRITDLLKVHRYCVHQARNGAEALAVLRQNADIQLVLTDFNMPVVDGLQLLKEIRKQYTREDLSVIGMSSDNLLSTRFLKMGANDFISKTFFTEEFYCRINQNIELLEYIKEIRDASNIDFLTNIYNRRYLFKVGEKLFESAKRKHVTVTVAMIDIDFFKKVNDQYGHEQGDRVLVNVARIIQDRFRKSEIVARMGGEEFCVLAINMDNKEAERIFNELRRKIESTDMMVDDRAFHVTVSIGLCTASMDSLDAMINHADQMLYKAKNSGRNKVVTDYAGGI